MTLELCPFCRSRCVTLWTETDGNDVTTDAWVGCDDCAARGPSADTESEAEIKWNAAAISPAERPDVENTKERQ